MKIYTLSCPITNEIRYVGITKNSLSKRFSQHLVERRNNKRKSWFSSLERKGLLPKIELLDEVEDDLWIDEEKFYISYFRFLGFNLVNMTEGGDRIEMTEEIRNKIRIKHLGKIVSDETKAKISKASLENRIGYYSKFSEEEVIKLRILKQQKKDGIKPLDFYKKKIIQKDLANNVIKIWDSISSCCKENNWSKGNIIKVCKNKIRKDGSRCLTAYGFKWSYEQNLEL